MDEKKKTKEKGLIVWRKWNNENLRGHYKIGKKIMKDYGLTKEDIDEMKRIRKDSWERLRRAKLKLEKEIQMKGGTIKDEEKITSEEETIEEESK